MAWSDNRRGAANNLAVLVVGSLVLLAGLLFVMTRMSQPPSAGGTTNGESLFVYCAAGIRPAVEQVAKEYEREYGVNVQLQYGGSNTLLNQIQVVKTGDLYIAADDSYIELARQNGLVKEEFALALMRPVIAVKKGNAKQIDSISDLTQGRTRVSLGNPDQAAIGKAVKKLLTESGQWSDLEKNVEENGVFKPTVPEIANDVAIGSVDASIIWDATARQYQELKAIRTPELDNGTVHVSLGVLSESKHPTAALRFARYLSARDKGLAVFEELGFETIEGDVWSESPELTFFVGSVNRRAVEPVIQAFEKREGIRVNTVYNGCGILTAQMRTILDQQQGGGFPDSYMACDVYYLETVKELFQDGVNVSDTQVVIAVEKGNPKNIQSLSDLARPGIRIAVGQPDQCTIGVLTRQLLQAENLLDPVMENVVTQTATSALLVPSVTTGSVDAVLAYQTDTLAETEKIDVISVDSPAALAIQPFSIARNSQQKHLSQRLFRAISDAKQSFETAGFRWRLDGTQASDSLPLQKPAGSDS